MRSAFIIVSLFTGLLWGASVSYAQAPVDSNPLRTRIVLRLSGWNEKLTAAINETKISVAEKRQEFKTYAETAREKIRALKLSASQQLSEKKEAIRTVARARFDSLKLYAEKREADNRESRIKRVNADLAKDIKRLNEVTVRLKDRLDALAGKGRDVTSAKTLLEEAERKVTETEHAAEIARASLEQLAKTETREVIQKEIANEAKAVREKIKAAHQALIRVINAVK